ncbi:hypothetical protein [Paraburkholderia aromaticivorans]|uniref:hypothetical protein n=1 Tax=Paraburkholderia aromaticivorans TaxID=2026199 RepID=UPI0038BC61B5
MKIFWSWQSDESTKRHRDFVKEALDQALGVVSSDLNLSEAERPELDHDTKGEPGLVEIATAIFEKIKEAAVFVADVTPIAVTPKGKHVANPNVMIELGYALHALGRESIVLVWNTDSGIKNEDLPFDLRHRRGPIAYTLPSGANVEAIKRTRDKLAGELAAALSSNLSKVLKIRDANLSFRLHPARDGMRSTWLQPDETIRHKDYYNGPGEHVRKPKEGTRCYMRIAAARWRNNVKPKRATVQQLPAGKQIPLFAGFTAGDGGANDLGLVRVGMHSSAPDEAHVVTQWFDDTAEVWGFSTQITDWASERVIFSLGAVVRDWAVFLKDAIVALEHLGAEGPIRVEAGVTGLVNTYWPGSDYPISQALDPEAVYEFISRDWSPQAQLSFLTAATGELCAAFAKKALSEQQVSKIINR